ncbi:MAG: ABC transporter ATP-binding protein [Bacilli bacterium]
MTLHIDHVTKRFKNFTAVDELTLEVPSQQMFGLLGANGAGKTTTMRMVLGLLEPTEGKITWNGKRIDYSTSNRIGYLPEERGLYPKLTVKDQLIYLGRLRGMNKAQVIEKMRTWLERFHITEYENKKVEELSKGNQQKIQFIASVLHDPQLIFLDEPFSGLDPVNVELLKSAVLNLSKEGASIVFSSHQMHHVEELCQSLCIMHRGKPILQGNLKEIKRSYGRKNVTIHTEVNLDDIHHIPGVTEVKKTADGYNVQIAEEDVARSILTQIASKGFITKFALEEPSLNEIFIAKVGASYE